MASFVFCCHVTVAHLPLMFFVSPQQTSLCSPKQADFFGTPFHQDSSQITGSVLGTLVFDIVVDLVVRCWMTVVVDDGGASAMTGLTVKGFCSCFVLTMACLLQDTLLGSKKL